MKVYLAHNYAAKDWLRKEIVPRLEEEGIEVTSRWIIEDKEQTEVEEAEMDLEDIVKADAVIFFSSQFGETLGKGKYFEIGYATAMALEIIMVGKDSSCVFYALGNVTQVEDIEGAIRYIKGTTWE